jgi:hypothetical protein
MANTHSKWVQGNLVYYDTYLHRWIDAIGYGVCKVLENFQYTGMATDAPSAWTTTLVEGGGGESTVALTGGAEGGTLLITTDAAENDGVNMQVQGEAFKFASGKPLYFGIKFQASEATQSDFLVGLAITTTDALGGVTDGVYFRKVDGSTTCSAVIEKNTTETTGTAMTFAATTDYVLEIFWDGAAADFFVDGVALTRLAQTNIPDDEFLSPVIHFLAGSANARTMTVDWVRCIQING